MTSVVSKIAFGNVKPGDRIATFKIAALANAHYWVQRGWAEVKNEVKA